MKYLLVLTTAVILFGCSATKKQQKKSETATLIAPSLELVWETDTLMTTAECVIYDKSQDIIYVSNINEGPWEKDGNGFLSKLGADGNVIELKWVEGLDAPKGLAIFEGSLFVNDIDQLIEIDIEKGKIKSRTKIGGDPDLNGLTVDESGVLYASGSKSFKIYRIEKGLVEVVVEGDLGRPNGVYSEKDRLLMLTNQTNKLMAIDKASKEITMLADSLGHADGIVQIGGGSYIVSNWKGQLFHLSAGMDKTIILDTTADEINAADIEFIQEKNLLIVPTFFDNRVRAYKLVN
jgi:hypothetical protein